MKSVFNEMRDIGVIWATNEAVKSGYTNGHPDWANLGQGEPEVGEMEGATPRIKSFTIGEEDNRHGPLNGTEVLRTAIASYYNRLYRAGKSSQYTSENVSVVMGGRLALTRIFSIVGTVRLGYKVPEYPAYEDLLNYQLERVTPVRIPSSRLDNYSLPAEEFATCIREHNLDAFLFSNPCNPTGHVIQGKELADYVQIGRDHHCTLIIDEVYSHFIFDKGKPAANPVSATAFVEDVNMDQVVVVDGLTKSFRYPGWRLAWIIGPEEIIKDLGRAASGIDGGPSLPVQRGALKLFEPGRVDQDTHALRKVFSRKQALALQVVRGLGIQCSPDTNGTFYIWADISQLAPPLNNSDIFFKEALKYQVIVIPGHVFDIHPGTVRKHPQFDHYIRLSFGPEEANLKMGLDRIAALIQSHKA
jgi:aspartate/methionine/tyrosine aminotransferase